MAYSPTTGSGSLGTASPHRELLPGEADMTTATPSGRDLEAHVETYRGFVLGMGLAAAHALVILLLLFWFLM